MIKGDKINLKPITEKDIEVLRHWRNIYAGDFFTSDQITKEQQKQWYQSYKDSVGRDYMWLILDKEGELCGTIALYNVNVSDRTATIGRILVIDAHRGKGYMKEAVQLVSDYALESMRLHKITLQVYLDNAAAIGVYSQCGFKSVARPVMIMTKESTDTNLWKKPMKIAESYDEPGPSDYESSCSNLVTR